MAEQILMFRKTVDNLTWAILGDTVEGEDFLNWDNEHPSKITLRVYSKSDQGLDAVMSSLNNTVLANFDQQDWFDCLFHTIYWYGIDITEPWYNETTSAEITDEWLPVASTPTGMAPDPFYGNNDPTINGEWEYFKFLDYSEDRSMSTTNNYLTISGVLGLSHTGTGDPDKLALFSMSMNFNNLESCKYSKNVSYVDVVGGGSMEKSVDRLFAEEWSTAVVGGKATAYNPDNYTMNKKNTVIAVGRDLEDNDLKYISYRVEGPPNYETVKKILSGEAPNGTKVIKHLLAGSCGVVGTDTTLNGDWTEIAKNVWCSTGCAVGANTDCNVMLIYVPEYDIFELLAGMVSLNANIKSVNWNTAGLGGGLLNDTQNTVLLSTDVYNVVYTGTTTIVVPTKATNYAAADLGLGIYTTTYNRARMTDTARCTMSGSRSPYSGGDASVEPGDYTYCFGLAGDYDAYLSDYSLAGGSSKTINRLYVEEWMDSVAGDNATLYDSTGFEGKPKATITRKGSSIDTNGIHYIQFENGKAFAYALIGSTDAYISSFTVHTCSSGGSTGSGPGSDSSVGETWIDDMNVEWVVTAKETDSDGKVYVEMKAVGKGWGPLLTPAEALEKAVVAGTVGNIDTLVPVYNGETNPMASTVAQGKVLVYVDGVTDPILKPCADFLYTGNSNGYFITRSFTTAEKTEMGLTDTRYSVFVQTTYADYNGRDTDTYLAAMRKASYFDNDAMFRLELYNQTTANRNVTLTPHTPDSIASAAGYSSITELALAAIANKHSISLTDLKSSTYTVKDTDYMYVIRINSTTYYAVAKKIPFDTLNVYTGSTTLANMFNQLNNVVFHRLYAGSTIENYWYRGGIKKWDLSEYNKYAALVYDPDDTDDPVVPSIPNLTTAGGQVYGLSTAGATAEARPYATFVRVLSTSTVDGKIITKGQLSKSKETETDTYTGPYIKITTNKITFPTSGIERYTIEKIEVSSTPF